MFAGPVVAWLVLIVNPVVAQVAQFERHAGEEPVDVPLVVHAAEMIGSLVALVVDLESFAVSAEPACHLVAVFEPLAMESA